MSKIVLKIKKFIALPHREKIFFFEAILILGMMRIGILLFSFKFLSRKLQLITTHTKPTKVTDLELEIAVAIGKSIEKSAQHTPWESACLVKAFTAYKMLKRRGISGRFYIGVNKDKQKKGEIKSHAWTECNQTILTGKSGHETFTIFSVYQW